MAYQPASVVSSDVNLQHIANVIYYDKVAVENLKANTPAVEACEKKNIPYNSGQTIRIWSYSTLAANTTAASEGTVGSGISNSSTKREVTLSQFVDYMSFSDLIDETAIDQTVKNFSAELGYRAALTTNKLCFTEFDAAAVADSATQIDLSDNEFLSAAISRQACMSLLAKDARPKADDGMFVGICHPLAAFDMINDNTAGGFLDLQKRTDSGQGSLQRGVQGYKVWEHEQVRWIVTTTVPTTSAFPSGSKTGYHAYVIGQDAFFAVSLGDGGVPKNKNFELKVKRYTEPSPSDPGGVIRATVAYNFKFVVTRRPATPSTFRRIRAEASIT